MGKNPAFQFYPSDWCRDLEEHPLEIEGAWIRICCKLWWSETRGKLDRTMEQWAKILRVYPDDAKRILNYIGSYKIGDVLPTSNGNLTVISRRMLRDEKERQNNCLRQQRFYDKKKPNAPITPTSQRSSSSSSSSTTNKDIYIVPEWVPVEAWNSYLEMRKKIRKPLTDYGKKRVIEKLRGMGGDPAAILDQSTMNSWQGIFALREESDGTRRGVQGNYRKVDTAGEISREDRDAIERARRDRQERMRNKGINQPTGNSN